MTPLDLEEMTLDQVFSLCLPDDEVQTGRIENVSVSEAVQRGIIPPEKMKGKSLCRTIQERNAKERAARGRKRKGGRSRA
jgi:hypothetical protein